MVVQTKLKIICLAAIILFNSGAIEYIGEIHEKSAEFTGGEGGIRTLGTTLRSYDGLANR